MVVLDIYKKKPSFLTPKDVVESLSLTKGQTVIDYGAGAGFWAIPLAKKVGQSGVVYAVDCSADRLQVLKSVASLKKVANIKTVKSDKLGEPVSLKQKVDLILVSNVLYEINEHEDFLISLAQNAEVGTKLVIVDWNQDSTMGPVLAKRTIEDQVVLLAAKAGFKFVRQLETGTFHFGLMFTYTGEKFHARKK